MYLCISARNGISHVVFGSLILLFLVSKWHGQKGFWSGGWLYFTHWPGGCDDPLLFVPDWAGSTAHQGVEQKGCRKETPLGSILKPSVGRLMRDCYHHQSKHNPGLWWGTGRLAFNVRSVWPVGTSNKSVMENFSHTQVEELGIRGFTILSPSWDFLKFFLKWWYE